MQSKISFFNKTLFKNTVSRFLPLWAAYAIIWILVFPVSLHSRLSSIYEYSITDIYYNVQSLVLDMGFGGGVIMSLVFSAFTAMAVFSYIYSSKSAGMMASLPIRREAAFLTVFSAGLCCLLASNVLVFLIAMAVEAAHGVLSIKFLLQWLALVSMCNVFFYGFASLCAMLTGQILVLPVVYAVLNFTSVVVEFIIRNLLDAFVFGMSAGSGLLFSFLSPVYYLLANTSVDAIYNPASIEPIIMGYKYNGWVPMIIYCLVGLICVGAALLLYRRRHMETASDIVAVRVLKPVFKYCLAFGCALCIGTWIFYSIFYRGALVLNVFPLLIFMLFGGFIGYFAAEMLIKKSFRVWRGTWKGFIIFSTVIVLLTYAWELDLFGYERRIPDLEKVEFVRIESTGEHSELHDRANIEQVIDLHGSIVENKAHHEAAGSNWNIMRNWVRIYYHMENGSIMSRAYTLSASDEEINDPGSDIMVLNDIFNSQEAIDDRKETEIPVSELTITNANIYYSTTVNEDGGGVAVTQTSYQMTDQEAMALYYGCILPDIADGTLGRIWLVQNDDYYNTVYDCFIEINLAMRKPDGSYINEYFHTVPTVDSERTNAWLKERGIELHPVGGVYKYEK
ncbi:MAG TPA: ABC transporter permease [Clostridiales bacterium]|nr:ABC transporter permease [Clostridiales bacterium]